MGFPWAAAIEAGGQVLGGLLGRSETISPYKSMKSAVKFADEFGIHRLTALGANPGYQAVPGSGMGTAVAQGASALADGIKDKTDPLKKSAVVVNEAQADLLRAQTHAISREIEENMRRGTTGARNVSNPNAPPGIESTVMSSDQVRTELSKTSRDFAPNFPGVDGQLHKWINSTTGPVEQVDMKNAPDPETDLWGSFKRGTLYRDVVRDLERNGLFEWQKNNRAAIKSLPARALQSVDRAVADFIRAKRAKKHKRPSRPKYRNPDLGPGPYTP